MSRGYIVIAQNNDTTDYLEQAYALALSIKISQSTVKDFAVCVDAETKKHIKAKHKRVFDHIIDIPWGDDAESAEWKINNKWKYYYMTPFDETVILDTDMIFTTDVSYWWDILSQRDVWVTSNVYTYRGDIVTSDYYRKAFTANHLPNVYTAFFYFKKSELATELFKMTQMIFENWQRFFFRYAPNDKPDWLSGDYAFALAMKILGIEHLCLCENVDQVPTFVHMKSHIQNIKDNQIGDDWTRNIPSYFTALNNFKVGNFHQTLPFHYVVKDWLNKDIITRMEKLYYAK